MTSTETVNAVLLGLKQANSDGIVQISTGGAEFFSGLGVKNMAKGAIAMAEYVHLMAREYDVNGPAHRSLRAKNTWAALCCHSLWRPNAAPPRSGEPVQRPHVRWQRIAP